MFYTNQQAENLLEHRTQILEELVDLQSKIVVVGQAIDTSSRVREHLLHGAARRVGVIRRSLQNVFSMFPPETVRPPDRDILSDVQINLHAFVIIAYGIHDNWAWVYVLQHNLEAEIGGRRRVGLFIDATQQRLPPALRDYLASDVATESLKLEEAAAVHRGKLITAAAKTPR